VGREKNRFARCVTPVGNLAIRAAGGIASPGARDIGIAQPSVFGLVAHSRGTGSRRRGTDPGENRYVLRPDLYGSSEDQVTAKSEVDEIDQLRAAEYGLLSLLLGKAPDADTLKRRCHAEGRCVGTRHGAISNSPLRRTATDDARAVSKEFFDLLHRGSGRGDLLPYGVLLP